MAKAPRAPRTVGRDESPINEERMPERGPERRLDRPDPNGPILTRSGRPAKITFTGDEDQFNLEKMGIFPPPGWDYAWKVKTVKGKEETEALVRAAANGWEPVPADRHDGQCMPKGHKGSIERGGQVLMERDMRLTIQARRNEKNAADRKLAEAQVMASLLPPEALEYMDLDHSEARRQSGVRRERESIGIRGGGQQYSYPVDEE